MKIFGLFGRKSANNYYNSKEFYKRCPDLAPRNVYLQEGRIITQKEIDKYFAKITRKTFLERAGEVIKKIKSWFKSDK